MSITIHKTIAIKTTSQNNEDQSHIHLNNIARLDRWDENVLIRIFQSSRNFRETQRGKCCCKTTIVWAWSTKLIIKSGRILEQNAIDCINYGHKIQRFILAQIYSNNQKL